MTPDGFAPLEADEAAYLMAELRGENDWPLVLPYVPDDRRAGALAILGLMKELGDAPGRVTEIPLGQIRFQWWRDALDEVFAQKARRHPLVLALEKTVGQEAAMRGALDHMVDQAETVLFEPAPPADRDAALALLSRVYGEGAKSLALWLGVEEEAAKAAAEAAAAHALARAVREGRTEGAGRPRAADLAARWAAAQTQAPDLMAPIRQAKKAAREIAGPCLPAALPLSLAPSYARGKIPGPLGKRTRYFRAMLTGRL